MYSFDLSNLINQQRDAPKLRRFIESYGKDAAIHDDWEDAVFVSFLKRGIELKFDMDDKLTAIFLFGSGDAERNRFQGAIPQGLTFDMSRDEIRTWLGTDCTSGGECVSLGERIPAWDKYLFDDYSIHIQYDKNCHNIELITLEGK